MSEVVNVLMKKTSDQSLLYCQTLLHMYPNYVWVLSLLAYLLLLLGNATKLVGGYLNLVQTMG